MGTQSLCCSFHSPKITSSFCKLTVPTIGVLGRDLRFRPTTAAKSCPVSGLKWLVKESPLAKAKGVFRVCALNSDSDVKPLVHLKGYAGVLDRNLGGIEPYRGKAGSVSFYGVTHHLVEESELVSAPFKEGRGSLLWVLAPVVLILFLILPPLFIPEVVDTMFKDAIVAEFAASLSCEAVLYVGIAIFVVITDQVQRPYLEFSTKRWGLITGLKGHLTTLFFSMGLKVVAPLVVTYVTWPTLGTQALLAVTPLLVGFLAQLALETFVDKKDSSCWPIVPIIFEVYRLYQLTRASHFIDGLLFMMRGAPITPQVTERTGALVAMSATFQAVGLVCLWSLLTFLLRLFPSRPVAEKY